MIINDLDELLTKEEWAAQVAKDSNQEKEQKIRKLAGEFVAARLRHGDSTAYLVADCLTLATKVLTLPIPKLED